MKWCFLNVSKYWKNRIFNFSMNNPRISLFLQNKRNIIFNYEIRLTSWIAVFICSNKQIVRFMELYKISYNCLFPMDYCQLYFRSEHFENSKPTENQLFVCKLFFVHRTHVNTNSTNLTYLDTDIVAQILHTEFKCIRISKFFPFALLNHSKKKRN